MYQTKPGRPHREHTKNRPGLEGQSGTNVGGGTAPEASLYLEGLELIAWRQRKPMDIDLTLECTPL